MESLSSRSISGILVYFNVNAYDPEQLIDDLAEMNPEYVSLMKRNMKLLLIERRLGSEEFYQSTACRARDEQSARQFFEDVYKYAFEGGEEPDVTDYWNRPKPTY